MLAHDCLLNKFCMPKLNAEHKTLLNKQAYMPGITNY